MSTPNAQILIIDDDKMMAASQRTFLEDCGYSVSTASSGAEGLNFLQDNPVDIVLTDLRMPGMSGAEVLTEIGERHPHLPVILLTAHGSIKTAVSAIQAGAFDFITKPPDLDALRVTIDRALEHTKLKKENTFLRSEMASLGVHGDRILGQSTKMLEVFELIDRVARTDSTVLITGETGTGKELVAQTIHYKSKRAERPLVACNCAALNTNLLESELFGHVKGAFTGAMIDRRGRFEDAHGGSLFLDEIGETGIDFQAKLLRVLQEGEVERVGDNKKVKVDVRIIASTNKDLSVSVTEGEFREDLFYRLRVVPVHLPPLRERSGDILPLAQHFLKSYSTEYQVPVTGISEAGQAYLEAHEWKGNVRELKHTIERAVVLARSDTLDKADLVVDTSPAAIAAGNGDGTLQDYLDVRTAEYLIQVLDRTGWQKKKTAEILNIDRATLYRLIKKHSLSKS